MVRRDRAGGCLPGSGADPPQASAGAAQEPRCRGQRLRAARAQHCQPGGFRCRGGGVACVRRGPRRNPGGSRWATRVDCGCRQRDGWHHRLCFGRIDHRAERAGRDLRPSGRGRGQIVAISPYGQKIRTASKTGSYAPANRPRPATQAARRRNLAALERQVRAAVRLVKPTPAEPPRAPSGRRACGGRSTAR
jgi:hypothetical protein